MNLQETIALDKKYYMNTFGNRIPVCFTHGEGIFLWDTEGRKYADFFAGIAVNALGYSYPRLVGAICKQAEKLIHCSSLYYIENQAKLAKLIVDNSCADRVFFGNSGAESNEGAIKLARIYYRKKGLPEKYEVISLKNSYHGRTLATLAATGQDKYQRPFVPLTPKFIQVPANDLSAVEKAVTPATCAILLEVIQGESGVYPLDPEYVKGIHRLCDQEGLLLIIDEIQTGLGRTGKLFGYQHYGVEPDIFTLAKALGGGFPIGALCAKEPVASAFEPGDHSSTFGGNPLACAAGLASMETILNEGLIENAEKTGDYFIDKLKNLSLTRPVISEVRGKGLMIGVQFSREIVKGVMDRCFEKGYLIGNSGNSILRLAPPLIVTRRNIDDFILALDMVLGELPD